MVLKEHRWKKYQPLKIEVWLFSSYTVQAIDQLSHKIARPSFVSFT